MCILLSLIFVTIGRVYFIQTTECNYRKYVMVESPFSSLEKAISSNRKFTVLWYNNHTMDKIYFSNMLYIVRDALV